MTLDGRKRRLGLRVLARPGQGGEPRIAISEQDGVRVLHLGDDPALPRHLKRLEAAFGTRHLARIFHEGLGGMARGRARQVARSRRSPWWSPRARTGAPARGAGAPLGMRPQRRAEAPASTGALHPAPGSHLRATPAGTAPPSAGAATWPPRPRQDPSSPAGPIAPEGSTRTTVILRIVRSVPGRLREISGLGLQPEPGSNVVALALRDAPARLKWEVLKRRGRELEDGLGLPFGAFVRALRRGSNPAGRALKLSEG